MDSDRGPSQRDPAPLRTKSAALRFDFGNLLRDVITPDSQDRLESTWTRLNSRRPSPAARTTTHPPGLSGPEILVLASHVAREPDPFGVLSVANPGVLAAAAAAPFAIVGDRPLFVRPSEQMAAMGWALASRDGLVPGTQIDGADWNSWTAVAAMTVLGELRGTHWARGGTSSSVLDTVVNATEQVRRRTLTRDEYFELIKDSTSLMRNPAKSVPLEEERRFFRGRGISGLDAASEREVRADAAAVDLALDRLPSELRFEWDAAVYDPAAHVRLGEAATMMWLRDYDVMALHTEAFIGVRTRMSDGLSMNLSWALAMGYPTLWLTPEGEPCSELLAGHPSSHLITESYEDDLDIGIAVRRFLETAGGLINESPRRQASLDLAALQAYSATAWAYRRLDLDEAGYVCAEAGLNPEVVELTLKHVRPFRAEPDVARTIGQHLPTGASIPATPRIELPVRLTPVGPTPRQLAALDHAAQAWPRGDRALVLAHAFSGDRADRGRLLDPDQWDSERDRWIRDGRP